jgi:hypothetical protein
MTFSLGLTGISANQRNSLNAELSVSDLDIGGTQTGNYAPSLQSEMSRGTAILCKGPDGLLAYYTIDAERSIPGYPPIMRPLGP